LRIAEFGLRIEDGDAVRNPESAIRNVAVGGAAVASGLEALRLGA
jgi:hypothetical protein